MNPISPKCDDPTPLGPAPQTLGCTVPSGVPWPPEPSWEGEKKIRAGFILPPESAETLQQTCRQVFSDPAVPLPVTHTHVCVCLCESLYVSLCMSVCVSLYVCVSMTMSMSVRVSVHVPL